MLTGSSVAMRNIEIDIDVHKAIENERRDFSESDNAILRRLLRIKKLGTANQALTSNGVPAKETSYLISINGHEIRSTKLGECYLNALDYAARHHEDLVREATNESLRRGKMVSRNRDELFTSSPHLRDQHATQISGGYFLDTNLSNSQTEARLKTLLKCAEKIRGVDIEWKL